MLRQHCVNQTVVKCCMSGVIVGGGGVIVGGGGAVIVGWCDCRVVVVLRHGVMGFR